MTSQTRRVEIAAPQRTKAWLCAGVHEHGHYVDNRRATILLGGEGADGSTTTAQASLTVADVRSLLAALEWMLAELELQTPKQCYRCGLDATPGQTEGWVLNRKANSAGWHCAECTDQVTVQWVGPQGVGSCQIAKCGGCERPVAFSEASEMTDAGWKLADGRWRCPACLAKSAPPQVVNCHQCQVAIATWSTRQMFDAGWNIGAGRYWYCPACKDAP